MLANIHLQLLSVACKEWCQLHHDISTNETTDLTKTPNMNWTAACDFIDMSFQFQFTVESIAKVSDCSGEVDGDAIRVAVLSSKLQSTRLSLARLAFELNWASLVLTTLSCRWRDSRQAWTSAAQSIVQQLQCFDDVTEWDTSVQLFVIRLHVMFESVLSLNAASINYVDFKIVLMFCMYRK